MDLTLKIWRQKDSKDQGKLVDISQEVVKETRVEDASVKIITWDGYGDRNILFHII